MTMIDLRSDTVTKPSDAMRRAMAAASGSIVRGSTMIAQLSSTTSGMPPTGVATTGRPQASASTST